MHHRQQPSGFRFAEEHETLLLAGVLGIVHQPRQLCSVRFPNWIRHSAQPSGDSKQSLAEKRQEARSIIF